MPSNTMSTAQAEREKPSRVELNVLVRPLAAHLPLVLAESEGQPQVSNEHRAMLREICDLQGRLQMTSRFRWPWLTGV